MCLKLEFCLVRPASRTHGGWLEEGRKNMREIHPRDRCGLCGKTKEQVRKLIVGIHAAVCSECIDLCNDILRNAKTSEIPLFVADSYEWDGTVVVASEDRDEFGPY